MVIRKTELPYAAVRRLCIVEDGQTVEKSAVEYAISESQQYIIRMMKSAAVIMKARDGSMIMLKDILAAEKAAEEAAKSKE